MQRMDQEAEEGCGVRTRAEVGKTYWKQDINKGLQAEQRARKYLDKLSEFENTASATRHLLQIALALGEVQQAFNELAYIAAREDE